ncbi:MAG: ATP-dependent Clp protease ATP-binding subunit [Acidobacteria bacterium]|nr:ATP-dependent Clp protease ATP-binding subunit [Acidobacteriota bacterium]MBV9185166.1 ATP-dependent Clp protease ATP-binding subunit [Acidobacteriota bacterium]
MFEKYNEKARRALFFARYEASKLGSRVIESEHILLGVLREGEEIIKEIFSRFNVKPEQIRREVEGDRLFVDRISSSAELPLSEESKKILAYAAHEAESMLHQYVGTEHLLIGILRVESSTAARILTAKGLNVYGVREETISILKEREADKQKKELPFLAEYARDLTAMAHSAQFDPLIGREKEVERIIQILSRRTKNNPILLGEPGVGKTAIVEGLAQRIVDGNVPLFIANKRILSLDLSLIVAGTKYRGQFEERLKGIIKELKENTDIIIFIDEIHSLIGAGSAEGSLDAANILKPALSRGEISCVGATTIREYRRYIEKDRSLLRRFQAINVAPPNEVETLQILEGVKERYENFHKVKYSDTAIRSAVYQSNRYITDRFFPDKAIDIIDEAGAKVKLRRVADTQNLRRLESEIRSIVKEMKKAISDKDFEKAVFLREREIELKEEVERFKQEREAVGEELMEVTKKDVEEIISSWTDIPVTSIEADEAAKLINMEDSLMRRVVGQDKAIRAISRAIRRSRLGVASPNRPMGSFIFLGSSGVGKTEVARRLAEFLFGSQRHLIRFDMSEYMEKHAVSKLIGSPPGYVGHEEGGQLTERVRRNPYSVVLLDEIEKAHPDIANILLQILEDGILTDSLGNQVDFRNTLIIMTSNLGTRFLTTKGHMGFREKSSEADQKSAEAMIHQELKKEFSPEFINRIDDIIIFNPLTQNELRAICRLLVDDVNIALVQKGVQIAIDDSVIDWLLSRAEEESNSGARPLRRAIQRYIEDELSEFLIRHKDSMPEWIDFTMNANEVLLMPRSTEALTP